MLSFLGPEKRDPDNISLMLRTSGEAYDLSDTLNMDMFDNSQIMFDTSVNDAAVYSSTNTSAHSSPSENPVQIKSESPALSQRSSFSIPKNPSNSSSQTSIANHIPQMQQQPQRLTENAASTSLANFQFGREFKDDEALQPSTLPPLKADGTRAPSYMPDFDANDWKDPNNLKYCIQVQDVPAKSRVETQIKVVLSLYPPPTESIAHLPADTISKPKLQLRTPFVPIPSALSIDTIVVCDSNPSKHVNICQGCLKRERKRAFRKKTTLPVEEAHWRQDKEKRAVIFNCREVVDIGPPVDIDVDGKIVQGRQIELPMRMACYCRHHNEKSGFRALFVARDYLGNVVARGSTSTIVITDDHKAANQKTLGLKRPNTDNDDAISPTPEDDPPRKRKAEPGNSSFASHSRNNSRSMPANRSPMFSPNATPSFDFTLHSPTSPQVNNYQRTASFESLNALMSRPMSALASPRESPYNVHSPARQLADEPGFPDSTPIIQRIIPVSGSIRGGIEVTLLGSGFVNGLVTKFGENRSISTHCWNDTTIVAKLPPSRIAGPVVVLFEGFSMADPQVFSYYDDTDRQLIELALQVVGIKMNGRLEDARDIARRIVGSGTGLDANNAQQLQNVAGATNRATNLPLDELETMLLKCLNLVDFYTSDFTPNWQLSNSEGQTMLHLASCLGLTRFASALLERGCRLDIQDKSGFTALHFAALHRNEELVEMYLVNGAKDGMRTYTGKTYRELSESVQPLAKVSQSNYVFNGDDSDSDSEYGDISDSDVHDAIHEEEEEEDTKTTRTFVSYFKWRGRGATRKSPIESGLYDRYDTQQSFWEMIYPNTGELLNEDNDDNVPDGKKSKSVAPSPPSYDEIFPTGSSSQDYSGAVLDPEKPEVSVVDDLPESKAATSEPESEEVILLQWKNKRKTISNDRMFLYFWLPLFVFILVWVSIRAVAVFDTLDASARLHEKITKLVCNIAGVNQLRRLEMDLRKGLEAKGLELGKMIEPVMSGARGFMEGTHEVMAVMTGTAQEGVAHAADIGSEL